MIFLLETKKKKKTERFTLVESTVDLHVSGLYVTV